MQNAIVSVVLLTKTKIKTLIELKKGWNKIKYKH